MLFLQSAQWIDKLNNTEEGNFKNIYRIFVLPRKVLFIKIEADDFSDLIGRQSHIFEARVMKFCMAGPLIYDNWQAQNIPIHYNQTIK